MHIARAILIGGLLAAVAGCRSADSKALFAHTQWESAEDARTAMAAYKHLLVVCVYEDYWEDRGHHELSLHHFKGTVVKCYKGDWGVSDRIRIVHGVDAPAGTVSNALAGHLMFVFTNEHTEAEIGLDTDQFGNYDSHIDSALQSLYLRGSACAGPANKSLQPTGSCAAGG